MRLQENSLYTTPQEREDLLKDKKKVMDALCFSLLGFLGCFKLGYTRAYLKTYDQSEGKLQLNAIGDTNHDVSLSVKLADDAGIIPNSAAQIVTKLLYKIKTKQIKGPDLNDDQVRDLVRLLKIKSHPGDTMVNAVVADFEGGSLNLGQLAAKLYQLSKLPKFKTVSGEFRTLVLKGQFTELFAKAGTVTPPAAQISNTSSVKVSTPVAAPVPTKVVGRVDSDFKTYSQQDKEDIYEELMASNNGSMRTPKALTNAGMDINQMPVILDGLGEYLREMVFVKKHYTPITDDVISNIIPIFNYFKEYVGIDAKQKIVRSLLCGWWMVSENMRDEGRFSAAWNAVRDLEYYVEAKAPPSLCMAVFKEGLFKDAASTKMLHKVREASNFTSDQYGNLILFAWLVNGGIGTYAGTPGSVSSGIAAEAAGWTFDTTLSEWFVRQLMNSRTFNAQLGKAVYKEITDDESEVMLNKIFDLKAPHQATTYSGTWQIPYDFKKIQDNDLKELIWQMEGTVGAKIMFYDPTTWEVDFKKEIKEVLGSDDPWGGILPAVRKVMGVPKGYITTEPFMDWFGDQLEGSRAATIFKKVPKDFMSGLIYLNIGIHFLDKKGVSPGIWLALYTYCLGYGGANGDRYQEDLEAIYEENWQTLETSLAGVFSTNIRDYAVGSTVAAFLLKVHKAGKFKAPQDRDFWVKLARYAAADLGEWDVPPAMQEALFGLEKDVDTLAVRRSLLEKYAHIRDVYYHGWMNYEAPQHVSILHSFIDRGFTDVVTEDMIPKDVMDFVKEHINDFGVQRITFFGPGGSGYGLWLKDLVKEAIKDGLTKTYEMPSEQCIINAVRTLGAEGLNEYLTHVSQADMVKYITISNRQQTYLYVEMWGDVIKEAHELTVDTLSKLLVPLGLSMKASDFDKSDKAAVTEAVCNMLNDLSSHGRVNDVDNLFDSMSYSVDLKKVIVDWFSKAGVLVNALKAIKGDEVAPLVEVDQSRLGTLMKYNNINVPTSKDIDYKKAGFKLSDFLKSHGSWKLEPLATSKDIDDQASLDRRTAEMDVFNKYRHGNIGVKFLKSFNVEIPIQKAANEIWDKDHPRSEIMDPVFHGTGSVAASFILRYGFAVVSSTDSSVVGRMLGDGIYFSNVLDKCGQYVSDGGYSRGKGNKGYLFQMRASLGSRGQDYQAGGGNLVSPEWVVYHPNDQLNIYKAHFIELVDQGEVNIIKRKVMRMDESVIMRLQEMTEHLTRTQGIVSYTFIDGQIPISETEKVDFENWDPSLFGSNITLEKSGLGPVLYISVPDPDVAEMYAVRYTSEFMAVGDDFTKYLGLLRGGAVS